MRVRVVRAVLIPESDVLFGTVWNFLGSSNIAGGQYLDHAYYHIDRAADSTSCVVGVQPDLLCLCLCVEVAGAPFGCQQWRAVTKCLQCRTQACAVGGVGVMLRQSLQGLRISSMASMACTCTGSRIHHTQT